MPRPIPPTISFRRGGTVVSSGLDATIEAQRDPIPRFGLFLIREGVLEEDELERLEKEVDAEILAATDKALAASPPAPESIHLYVHSPDVDPTSPAFASEPKLTGDHVSLAIERAAAAQHQRHVLVAGLDDGAVVARTLAAAAEHRHVGQLADLERAEQLGVAGRERGVGSDHPPQLHVAERTVVVVAVELIGTRQLAQDVCRPRIGPVGPERDRAARRAGH